jgi:hypothetical protein
MKGSELFVMLDPRVEFLVAQRGDVVPGREPGALRRAGDLAGRADGDAQRSRDLAVASLLLQLESKNLFRLAHGQSLRRHLAPLGAPRSTVLVATSRQTPAFVELAPTL